MMVAGMMMVTLISLCLYFVVDSTVSLDHLTPGIHPVQSVTTVQRDQHRQSHVQLELM